MGKVEVGYIDFGEAIEVMYMQALVRGAGKVGYISSGKTLEQWSTCLRLEGEGRV